MAHTLKLDIYYFRLNRIVETVTRNTKNGIRIGYKVEQNNSKFDEFVKSLTLSIEKDDYMKSFLESFINGFNNAFVHNQLNTKAISITTDLYNGHNSKDYTAWGIFKGGMTGIRYDVYNTNNAIKRTGTVFEDSVASLHYFYKIWLPKDSNVGVLMIQSYTSSGCVSLFKEQLEQYFISTGYKISWSKCVPKSYIDKYLKDGYINEIHVLHFNRDKEKVMKPLFTPFMEARRRSIFTKFNIPLGDFMAMFDYQRFLKEQIKVVDLNFDEEQDVIKLFYENNGKRAHASLADIEKILPVITLDGLSQDEITQEPKWEELNAFTRDILNELKKQIHYTPQKL